MKQETRSLFSFRENAPMSCRIAHIFCLLLCFFAANLTAAFADVTADARKAIEANYAKMSASIDKKEVKGYAQFFTDGARLTNEEGKRVLMKKEIALLTNLMRTANSAKATIQITKFALRKGKAVATIREHTTMVFPGERAGADDEMKGIVVKEQTWTRSGGGWKIKTVKQISSQIIVNGKPMTNQEIDAATKSPKR